MAIQSFKELLVWQKSMELVHEVYVISRLLPKAETYILVSQTLCAAISIPSNIAEGYKRRHKGEYLQFLGIADASAAELETQLLIIKREYSDIACEKCFDLLIEVQKMLHGLSKSLK